MAIDGEHEIMDKELEVIDSEPRDWKGILISLLVIFVICGLIGATILFLRPHLEAVPKEKLRLEDVLLGQYTHNNSNATWVSDNEILYRDLDGTIFLKNIETDWKTVLASNFSLARFQIERYTLSADHQYLLLAHDVTSRRSYSFTAKYMIYDTKNSVTSALNVTHDDDIQFAGWGPKESQLVVVSGNNIFYIPRFGEAAVKLTFTGQEGVLWNGVPDLINGEFVLKRECGIWWQEQGERFAYASYDNSYVDRLPVLSNAPPVDVHDPDETSSSSTSKVFPSVISYPYPKPGRRIAITSLFVADVTKMTSKPVIQVTPPREMQSPDHYLLDVTWKDEDTLIALWTKRFYNKTVLARCRLEVGWTCDKLLEEQLPTPKGWLSISEAPLFAEDYYFIRMPVADGTAGSFHHVSMNYMEGNKRHFLTHGQYVVTKLLTYRQDSNTLYFVATATGDPGVRHVHSVMDMESPVEKRRQQSCLSCDWSPGCLYNDAKFSPSGRYLILECLGPGTPRTELRHANNSLIEVLNTNPKLEEWAAKKVMPRIKHLQVPLPGGSMARMELILPDFLSETETTHHFPLVIELDGRPERQSVSYKSQLTWGHYLASKKEYIVAHIDVRGSCCQGQKYEHRIYHHLGEQETEDLLSVVKYIRENLQYIDKDKIAIYGKGFGGYLSLSLISRSPFFTCGVAVSPVTSWRNYAAAFVEKFMATPRPTDNYINYEKTDLVRNLETRNLKDKQLLLVHGTSDRIVNMQNTMLMMKALTDRNIPYKLQLYPDADHSLYQERFHVHQVIEDLFTGCFQFEDDEDERFADIRLNKVIKGGKRFLGAEE